MQKLILTILIFAAAYAVGMTARSYAAIQQGGNTVRCYERCTTDVTGATHCVSWCQ